MTLILLLLAGQGSAWASGTTKTVTYPVSAKRSEAATRTLSQTIALNEGWNWVSFNLEITLEDLKAALVEALPGTSITIKSRSNGIVSYNGARWRGQLSGFNVAQMYMIKVTSACEISLQGSPIDPGEHPVSINGENWIAFPFNEAMTVAEAFDEFALRGDIITSQTAFAVLTDFGWRGTLTTLEPGQGYVFHSASPETRPFTFPFGESMSSVSDSRSVQYETHWPEFNYNDYQFNQPVVAFIQIDGSTIDSSGNWEDLEIAAFVGDECRGHAFLSDYTEDFDDPYPVVELPVYYDNTGEAITFKLYDHTTGIEYGNCTPNIDFLTGEEHVEFYLGSDEPVILSFIDDLPADEVTLAAYPNEGQYWASFYCGTAWYTLPEGAQAYTMDAEYHLYRLGTDGRTIPEDFAVVIISDSEEVTLTRTDDTSDVTDNAPDLENNYPTGGNILQGSDVPIANITSGTLHVLGVAGDPAVFGFHPYARTADIPAHKAYFVVQPTQ